MKNFQNLRDGDEMIRFTSVRIKNIRWSIENNQTSKELMTEMIDEIERLQSLVQELEQEQRWIPVSERLPEINKTVLVVCGSVTIAKRKVDIIKNYCWVEIDGMELKHVTHWQSLPKLPQEEE